MEQWLKDNWQATRECSEKIFLQCPKNRYTMTHATSWNSTGWQNSTRPTIH